MAGKEEEGVNPESYELWLQERCRMMLSDCLMEYVKESSGKVRPGIDDFVERFMKSHNLK